MKDIYDMGIGESFYLKETVATLSTRTGKPCEFDEERIDINDLIIAELENIKEEMEEQSNRNFYENGWWTYVLSVFDKHISKLKGK